MMRRLRLNRSLCVSLSAIASLIALSYFPLSHIRAASVGATILPSAGKPLVNLQSPQAAKLSYTGSAESVAALKTGAAIPTALAAADFNADGAPDVVAGYATAKGGVLVLMRGNPDAYAPTDTSLYQKAMKGNVPATFLSNAAVFEVPESPDFVVTGDFKRDGNQDVLVAARGGSLYLLEGDGHGNLLAPQIVPLTGQVRALAVTGSGHVAVSLDGASGAQLVILHPTPAGLIAGATYTLPSRGDAVVWGNLDGGADVAVGAGANVMVIYNALRANAQTETVNLPFSVRALAIGNYILDRDGRSEIAALADDGSIQILQHGTLDTTPFTSADLIGRRAAILAKDKQPSNPTSLGAWSVARPLSYKGSAPAGPVSASAFNSPRLAASSTHDLMVIDGGRAQLNILDTSGTAASPSAGVSFSGTPIAALALPEKIDAGRDIVVLTSSQSAPMLVTSKTTLTLNVNTTADIDPINACTTSTTTIPNTLSLREAICLANNYAPDTTTINLPSGTYDLTSLETGEVQIGTGSAYSLSIVGSGTSSTIIQQTDGHDRIFEIDPNFIGNIPVTISNVTLQGGNCTTGIDCGFGGGAILGGGPDGSPNNITLTNVVVSNNSVGSSTQPAVGGAMQLSDDGQYNFTNCTFAGNTAVYDASAASGGTGGAINVTNGNNTQGMTLTNCSFTGNTAQNGGGGAVYSVMSETGLLSITGSTFTGNTALDDGHDNGAFGGAIVADGDATISNSRITGNTSADGATFGSGLFTDDDSPFSVVATNNWWGCNGGPGASGCDTAVTSGSVSLATSPYLVLSISANPTQIDPNGTSTLTADLTHNSASTGGFSVPNGTPVTFGGTLDSSVNPTGTTLTSGQATSTYTAGSSAGNGTGTATVDNQTVSTPVDILVSVTVTTSPAGLSITVDGTNYTAPQSFNWVVGSLHTISTTSPQAGPTGSQYVFSSWSDSGAQSHSVTAPTSATTYTASFNTQYQLTTLASPSADGSVTPASGGYYAAGASIPVTATANAGFQFNNWTSSGGSFDSTTSASTNFHMPSVAATVTGNFTVIVVAAPTSTSVSSNNNPSFTMAPGNSVTFTATVTSNTTVNAGTVTFSDPANNFTCSGGNTVPVSNGQATCTTSFTTEGSNVITAAYNGTVNFQGSSGMLTQVVNNHTVVTGNQFCNQGSITVPSTAGAATPYPSNIFVTGLGNVETVTVALNGISSSNIQETDLLLVGPTGAALVPFAKVGDGSTISDLNIVLDDAAASLIPGGSLLVSGSFKPTSITGSTSLVFPAPAPVLSVANYAATDGAATLTSQFGGTAANGTWALYAMDNSGNGAATIGGGWCVNITPATAAVTVTKSVTSVGPYNAVGQVISYSFVAKNTGNVTLNTVGITDTQTAPAGSLTSGPTCQSLSSPAGTCSGSATTLVSGQSATFTGTYTITQADLDNGSVNDSATASGTPPTGPPVTSTPSTATVTLTPTVVQITITTSPANLLVSADGGTPVAAPLVESWAAGSTHTITTTSPQTGGTGVQYVWSSWSDSGAISHSITVPSTAATYTASFNTQYQLTTAAAPSADGTVTPASGGYYAAGATIPVTATANAGFTFSNWSSSGGTFDSTTAASTNFHMPASPATVTGNFTTASQPQVTLTPPSMNFGNVYLDSMVSQEIMVQNTGNATLTFTGITLTGKNGGGEFRMQNSCPKNLLAGKTCEVEVFFTASHIGPRSNTLSFTDNAPGSPQQVGFTATVINPIASFKPTQVNFGTVKQGQSKSTSVTIANTGTTELTITSVSITGADMGDFGQTNNCTSLAPNHKCIVSVTFTPTMTGSRSADLTVMDNAQSGTTNIPLTGTGN
jgi:hypothetical protein